MNTPVHRLATGGRIDRAQALPFSFDGRPMQGLIGDTLASALLANGVRLVGRSFKYHRPRGIYAAGAEEPNALVSLGSGGRLEPNLPATQLELAHGMAAHSQNRWPSLALDLQSVNGLFAPFLSAGFYYKTFMGPTRRSWMFYEHFIRKAAGLGRAGLAADPDAYEVRHAFTDVAVVGAGPAGLAAARAAARGGARVMLIEQDFLLGGQLLAAPSEGPAAQWLSGMTTELAGTPNVRLMPRTTAFGAYDGHVLGLIQRQDPAPRATGAPRQTVILLHAQAILYATGAIEQPLVFANNDRPGIMLASAIRAYLHRYAVLPGHHALIHTTHDGGWDTAIDLAAAGAEVALVDTRPEPGRQRRAQAQALGIQVYAGARLTDVRGSRGVKAARIEGPGIRAWHACDLIGLSAGWSPAVHLTSHQGSKPVFDAALDAFVPGVQPAGVFTAGAITGQCCTRQIVQAGHDAGTLAAAYCGQRAAAEPPPLPDLPPRQPDGATHQAPPTPRGKAFVDLQMDVTAADIALAHREGYESVEHLKRYTTLGMGTDQGKTSNFAALSAMAALRGAAVPAVGTTTFRPPYTPVAIGALAGRAVGQHYKPVRRTPLHDWHLSHGADMLEVGWWMRPWYYRTAGPDADTAYIQEMRIVREAAGLMDISTLGKIAVQGPDAALFLNRVYANAFAKLPVGRARYGVMLRDDGVVFDDGTTSRLSEQDFFMTTSTAKAAEVQSWLEFLLDTAWPDLRVAITSVSDEWAAMSIAGPRSRIILADAFQGLNLSDDALPHMGVLESEFNGKPMRIMRLSYSGERAYELYVAASAGEAAWCALLDKGEPHGLKPYGTEALGALRIEKGHAAGPEIDGRTTLDDLGMGRMVAKQSGFVGDVLRRRPALQDQARQRLVGLECLEAGRRLTGGAILFGPGEAHRGHGRGRITSVTWSPSLGKSIGLGLLSGAEEPAGQEVVAVHTIKGDSVRARVVSPVFLDPEGSRLHA
ncbi:sarcosine oxidase subunit alpha family protein [Castellaniella hirudinis]|uniref:sarcosine oxidase subunit alpha family protein n=1 Tax=Castellaniella hirudinis TaxID=1144617 RepID=UPI0039C3D5E0